MLCHLRAGKLEYNLWKKILKKKNPKQLQVDSGFGSAVYKFLVGLWQK